LPSLQGFSNYKFYNAEIRLQCDYLCGNWLTHSIDIINKAYYNTSSFRI